ncbi:hypothetical protein OIU77_005918 [Salix suchowensis]|uniref:Uncharacterized protein n=1 Tax=Salix suchowensis TaxID=1278906 RepID=A0ABQ9ATT0_9ROSI|nr:hypothetical protein OIU77_005918 [Salix suchowensis]
MNLSDIKNRQARRNYPMSMFPPVDTDGKKAPANQSCISKGSCRLLRVLSCKDPTSVAVATSFLVPQGNVNCDFTSRADGSLTGDSDGTFMVMAPSLWSI